MAMQRIFNWLIYTIISSKQATATKEETLHLLILELAG
ncbi:hypothetical protein FHT05_001895 [Xanthomonas arboricola]|nr:hypothetical protein [Xanthomonas arboricola]